MTGEQDSVHGTANEGSPGGFEEALRLRELVRSSRADVEFIRHALDAAAIVAITDVKGTITFVNDRFCEISGYSRDELLGENHRILASGAHHTDFFKQMYRTIARGGVWHGEICNRRKSGELYWVDTTIVPRRDAAGKIKSYTAIRFDVSTRKRMEAELRSREAKYRELATTDPLTGIPNRRFFVDSLKEALLDAKRSGAPVTLVITDVDHFKDVNDAYGHHVGDHLMTVIAERLTRNASRSVTVGRIGGDEFGTFIVGMDPAEIWDSLEASRKLCREPVDLGAVTLRPTMSSGVAVFPGDGESSRELLKAADMALYRAKGLGRNRIERFDQSLRDASESRARVLSEIAGAMENHELQLYYQPIVPADESKPVSLEALLRWVHPTRGLLTPRSFDSVFDNPLIAREIGKFVLDQVFIDAVNLRDRGFEVGRISINLTNADFHTPHFAERFFELSDRTGIPLTQFGVEVTETMFFGRGQGRLLDGLRRLHDGGVQIALDDFGTGFASLTHLRNMPIDVVKIDRSFVENITTSPHDLAITQGVISISKGMGKTVVAEGVESLDQADALLKLGCDALQGWFYAAATQPCELATAVPIGGSVARVRPE